MNPSTSPTIEDSLRYQAETQLLRAQFNGDFLCNTLVLLQSCLLTDKPEIERLKAVIDGMADYYSYALGAGRDGTVPLSEEWSAVKGFLAVQKIRYGNGLELDCDISKKALDFPVPRIFLQPLVDNAVKYSRKTSDLPVKVRIRVSRPKKEILLAEIGNTGPWYEHDGRAREASVSLDNLRQRLAALYPGKKHELTISATDSWVTVKIRLLLS